jgi:uncharacterized membrane protein YbhN (UPF0104 family)
MFKNNKLLSFVQTLFFFLAWSFIVIFIVKNLSSLKHFFIVQRPFYLLLAFFCLFPALYILLLLRQQLSKVLGLNISLSEQIKIYSHNTLMKYLPGGIWNHLDAVVLLEKNGHTTYRQSGKLVFLEMYWRVIWGVIFFGPFVFGKEWLWLWGGCLLLFFLTTYSLSPRHPCLYLYSKNEFIYQALLNGLYWFINGLSFVFLYAAYQPEIFTLANSLFLVSSACLSWIGGFLFLPAPSGLGVREFLLSLFLEKFSLALTFGFSLSLLERMLILVRDLVLYFGAKFLIKR